MVKKIEVNIKCPTCGTTMVTAYKGEDIKGILQHKCGKCRRYWNVDYTAKILIWAKGKEESTAIKEFRLNLTTGSSSPVSNENIDKALLRRKGA